MICGMELTIARANRAARYALIASTAVLVACQPADGIDESGQVFEDIASDATVSLVGNEPFWGMEIAPAGDGYIATYSTPENIEGASFEVSRFAGNNGLGFSGTIDAEAAQITLTPGDCSDTMSDRAYPYTATVAIGETTLYGCGYTSDEPFVGDESQ